ncbi:MAG: hypothetical protein HN948_06350 [Clostridia bacterium]|jgi:hypothetical protein|nr:hypothetical protein [Clostridia bacterium]MBT7122617.1 hypothetical protein [Clostridia bacterium]
MSIIKEKLTEQQLRIVQIIAGILSGGALIVSLFVVGRLAGDNVILTYLWLVVFVIIMFGRRFIEKKFRLRLFLYNLVLVDTLVVGILIYLGIMFFTPASTPEEAIVGWSDAVKLVVIIVPALALLVLGVIMPLIRYKKRVEDGTLRSVRLPEPKEEEETDEPSEPTGPMSIEQQVAAMTKEIDGEVEKKDDEE